ncbi:SAM-dependent methyltransferase, partial [bacterium]|nr:SAM-dependent methyltransferase [bacterium]
KIKNDTISGIFDNSPAKLGKYLPGSRIPIIKPTSKNIKKSDIIIIFAWNLKKEIISELKNLINKRTKIGVIIPKFKIDKI